MQNLFRWSFLLLFFVFACKSSQEVAQQNIDEKMNAFFVALEKQDFEKAKTLVTPSTQKVLEVVMADAKKYKEFNDKPQPIRIEILERKIVEKSADYKIKIIVGEKVREQTIHCVLENEIWYLDCPEDHLTIFRYVIFYNTYDTILVLYKQKYTVKTTIIEVERTHKKSTKKSKKHTGRGKKKGHDK
jgi:hypothetical protein